MTVLDEKCIRLISDAGVVGDYSNARIFVYNTSSGANTGIFDADGTTATNQRLVSFNATRGLIIQLVIAWSTRFAAVEAVRATNNAQNPANVT